MSSNEETAVVIFLLYLLNKRKKSVNAVLTCTYKYQGIRNVTVSEVFVYVINERCIVRTV